MSGFDPPMRPPLQAEPEPERSSRRWLIWFAAIALFGLIVLGIGAISGYSSGLKLRTQRTDEESSLAIQEQFDLGVIDLLEGRYEIARQRFAYILEIEPGNTAARELLSDALIALDQPTPTPSLTPSPTLDISPTPTLDLGSLDGLFAAAQTAHAAGDYDAAENILITLIAEAPDFRREEVNQILFNVLRNRGLEKIWSGNREEGIYDLTLAERLQALDNQATSWRGSAAFYMFANSYFGLDWQKATEYFSQLCGAAIWDTCWKFSRAAWEFGNMLLAAEDSCAAIIQYDSSLRTFQDDNKAPTATEAVHICMTATAPAPTPTPTPSPTFDLTLTITARGTADGPTLTPTPTGTADGPTLTPTSTATSGPSATPSGTPTPTPTDTPTSTG